MVILNIIDDRKRRFRWGAVNARAEPTEHDNSCADSDQAPIQNDASPYEELIGTTVASAIAWAQSLPHDVTLYLGDEGDHLSPGDAQISN